MSRHPMTPVDAAWLRMDRPTNLMVVTTVMWFDEPVDRPRLRALIDERLVARFPRFRQRVVEDGGLFWEDVEDFDLDDHLHDVRLPAPAGRAELEDFASGLVSVPPEPGRPLWDLHLVAEYGTGCAAVFRMHHAIADGIALTRLLLSLTDDPEAGAVPVSAPVSGAAETVGSITGSAVHALADLAAHPLRLTAQLRPGNLVDLTRTLAAQGVALAELTLLPADRETALRGTAGVSKRVLWSDPLPLAEVREAGHRTGTTVNDLLLTAVAGALRTHLVRRRSPVHDVRAIVPFNLRSLEQPLPAELGNRFGLVYLQLPLTVARRDDRLRALASRTRRIKHSAQGLVSYGILEVIGRTPRAVEQVAIDVFTAKGTGVMTNVPGPRRPVTLAGTPLAGSIGWGPTSGELGLGVALFSYAGSVVVGLCVDEGLVPEPDVLLSDILAELDALLAAEPVAGA
ncbi:wax ester/triacylglycerol synthase family O-acyltransferase [Marmoricola sp. RAF53]|uniref:wax ester/triacylglycerol synthase family O-acyltransferase n=1 Tax=Marmoricola sp. RAF53 TaxID=3233059 RepID=UPI003F9904CF